MKFLKLIFKILILIILSNMNIIYMIEVDSDFSGNDNNDNSGIYLLLVCFISASIFLYLQYKNLPSNSINADTIIKPIKYATLKNIPPLPLNEVNDVLPNIPPSIPPQILFFTAFFFYYSLGLTIYVCYLVNLFGSKTFLDNFKRTVFIYISKNFPVIYKYWNYICIFLYTCCVIILYYI